MSYHEGSRALQDRFGTRRIADRLDERFLARPVLDAGARATIERADMFFLATADADGRPDCSYKGGDPGFVRVLDDRTIAFPDYDGNGMFRSLGNLALNPAVGLLFVDFTAARPSRLRVNGVARASDDDALLSAWPGAQLAVHVAVREAFPNCPRYVHRMALVERSVYVPRAGTTPPEPDWKRADWARDALSP